MDIFRPLRRCFCCGKKKDLLRIYKDTIYSERWIYYHQDCFVHVLRYPERYAMTTVDRALEIDQLLRDEDINYQRELEARRSKIEIARARSGIRLQMSVDSNPLLTKMMYETLSEESDKTSTRTPPETKGSSRFDMIKRKLLSTPHQE